jgi:hypothetical protein
MQPLLNTLGAISTVVIVMAWLPGRMAAQASAHVDHLAPLDAIATIVDAFHTHAVVGLEEEHTDARSSAFRLSLIRDPRFATIVNDIVVEFGNSLYQDVVDQFITGEPVEDGRLKRVWQDTTQAQTIWDRPIYEAFFRAVRQVNDALPAQRRLRVLLGDPPVDWDRVQRVEDLRGARGTRDTHPADVILREVLAKHRRALVIYGALHLWKHNLQGPNLIERVEQEGGITPFVVITHPLADLAGLGVDPAHWPVPSVALTRGTSLENQVDAVLYLGPVTGRQISHLSPALCADPSYREMRSRRMTLAGFAKARDLLVAECEAAQNHPDFSGAWTPVESGSDRPVMPPPGSGDPPPQPPVRSGGPPPPPPPPRTLMLTITQSTTEMKVERRVDAGGRETSYTFTYRLDGTESTNQMGPIVSKTTAAWDGVGLVLSSGLFADGKEIGQLKEVYRLQNGELTVESTRQTPAGVMTGKDIYRKSDVRHHED